MKNQNKNGLPRIEYLIGQEKDVACRIFPEEKLVSRLKTRLKAEMDQHQPSFLWHGKLVPILVGVLVLICGTIFVLDKAKSRALPEDKLKVTFDLKDLNIKVIWFLDENLNLGDKK